MEHIFWENKWKNNDIKFHLNTVYQKLIHYFSALSPQKIMVPLCGKSLDLNWLRLRGHEVVGVELSPIACESFFKENKINFVTEKQGEFIKFKGDHITLWNGDFFKLPDEAWENVTALYDRAAFFALPHELRKKYADEIKSRAKKMPQFIMLLITVKFHQEFIQSPPFSIDENEVTSLYGDVFSVEKLPDDGYSAFLDHPKFKNVSIVDQAYWLKKLD